MLKRTETKKNGQQENRRSKERKTDTEKEMYREGQIKSVGVFGR